VVSTIKTPSTHGEYFLEFNRSVGSCAKLATIGSIDDGHISVLKGNTTTLIVHIKNDAGVFQDASFSVALIC